jgi:enterobacteria phage integrase
MATMRLRYVHSFVDKTGRPRYYFRYRGKRSPLPGLPGSAEFSAAYDEAQREAVADSRSERRNNIVFADGTLGSVIDQYLAGKDFASKAPATIRAYRGVLDQLKEAYGGRRITDLRERHIRAIRKRFKSTSRADLAVMLLGTLWTYAKEELAMELGINPAADIARLHRRGWSHEPWPQWVIEKFESEARPKPIAQLALALLLYTGQRGSDVVRIKWADYDGIGIAVRQLKTGAHLWIRCHKKLKAILDSTPRQSEFILTSRYGSGYTAGGLRDLITAATAQIGAVGCTAHDLRCNAAIALAEAGCNDHEIMAVTGHRTFREAQRYTAKANQKKLSTRLLLNGNERVANLGTRRQPDRGKPIDIITPRKKRTFSRRPPGPRRYAPAHVVFGRIIFFFGSIPHSI